MGTRERGRYEDMCGMGGGDVSETKNMICILLVGLTRVYYSPRCGVFCRALMQM